MFDPELRHSARAVLEQHEPLPSGAAIPPWPNRYSCSRSGAADQIKKKKKVTKQPIVLVGVTDSPALGRFEFWVELLLPPSVVEDFLLSLEDRYNQRWLPKYGPRRAADFSQLRAQV